MAEPNKTFWPTTLVSIIWVTVCGFAGLCITGFFYLNARGIANADQTTSFYQLNAAQININSQRLSKLEECMLNTKESLQDLKVMIRGIDEKITRHMEIKK